MKDHEPIAHVTEDGRLHGLEEHQLGMAERAVKQRVVMQ